MQMYANFSILAALVFYCFTDVGNKGFGKFAKFSALAMVAVFVVTEGIALVTHT